MAAQASAPTPRLVLPLVLGDVWVAIDPGIVVEVLGTRTWMRVPGSPRQLPGILAWRSRAIAVLDLRDVLGVPGSANTPPPRTVIARADDCTFAFFVDVAREARTVDASAVTTPHAVGGRFVTHELALDGRVMPIVDVAAMIGAVANEPVEHG